MSSLGACLGEKTMRSLETKIEASTLATRGAQRGQAELRVRALEAQGLDDRALQLDVGAFAQGGEHGGEPGGGNRGIGAGRGVEDEAPRQTRLRRREDSLILGRDRRAVGLGHRRCGVDRRGEDGAPA